MGSELPVVLLGIGSLGLGISGFVFGAWQTLRDTPGLWSLTAQFINGKPPSLNRDEVLADAAFHGFCLLGSVLYFIPLGLVLSFRKDQIVVDRAAREIRTGFRLLCFKRDRTYDLKSVSSISFGRDSNRLPFVGLKAIWLDSGPGDRQKLCSVPWSDRKKGRELAQKIAAFLGVPGPLDRVAVK